ncbi:MAG: response regulator transcription factor [Clostridia bacterium]|nr:response regulator transcription factor [Clostridia bacterium]
MQKILIVEDDPAIITALEQYLRREEFDPVSVKGERDAVRLMDAVSPEILLIDLSLADGDGFSVCRAAKERGIPAVFLTASGDENSVVKGLDLGADDYISKPYRPRELVSRIRSVLRRNGKGQSVVKLGGVSVDTEKCVVTKDGEAVPLSALEFRLLMVFINNRGKLLSRTRLLDEIWDAGGDFVNDNTLTVYIKRLREKIEDDPSAPAVIKTVRGLGYRVD